VSRRHRSGELREQREHGHDYGSDDHTRGTVSTRIRTVRGFKMSVHAADPTRGRSMNADQVAVRALA